jgi:hypothetical protein
VGRPERPLNPLNGPVSRFAHELRQLRAAAGYPTYRSLARRALYSASVLSSAASGVSFPTLQVTLAFARACGADPAEWQRRWEAVAVGEGAVAFQGTGGEFTGGLLQTAPC